MTKLDPLTYQDVSESTQIYGRLKNIAEGTLKPSGPMFSRLVEDRLAFHLLKEASFFTGNEEDKEAVCCSIANILCHRRHCVTDYLVQKQFDPSLTISTTSTFDANTQSLSDPLTEGKCDFNVLYNVLPEYAEAAYNEAYQLVKDALELAEKKKQLGGLAKR